MPWNPRIIQNNRSIFGESLELFFFFGIKFTGKLAKCRFRPLHTESALISAAYYAALADAGTSAHTNKWSSGCRAILLLQLSFAAAE